VNTNPQREIADLEVDAFTDLIATGDFDAAGRQVISAVYDALAEGEPVSIDAVAQALGRSSQDVAETVSRCNVEFKDELIVGFGGLSLIETAHAFELRDRRLYTWCAWDPLFIALILGEEARVESVCPVTRTVVSLTVGPTGVRDVTPSTAVLSMRIPDESCRKDTITNFCSVVLLFATDDAANQWIAGREGAFVMDLHRAFELGQIMVQQRSK
jgi:alkylmercury lyase